jgi:hypothetical protein
MFYNETNQKRIWSCPVIHFLGHAVANKVFMHQSTAANFFHLHLPASKNSQEFCILDYKKTLPIFRSIHNQGRDISQLEVLTANSVWTLLNALGIRAGYTEPLNSYAYRRGFGNRIHGKFPNSRPFTRNSKAPAHASLGRRVFREDMMPVIVQNDHLRMGRLRSKARKERLKKARADSSARLSLTRSYDYPRCRAATLAILRIDLPAYYQISTQPLYLKGHALRET